MNKDGSSAFTCVVVKPEEVRPGLVPGSGSMFQKFVHLMALGRAGLEVEGMEEGGHQHGLAKVGQAPWCKLQTRGGDGLATAFREATGTIENARNGSVDLIRRISFTIEQTAREIGIKLPRNRQDLPHMIGTMC